MEKYYLDEQGLIKLLQTLSKAIKDKTSGTLELTDGGEPKYPNNFLTVQGIFDYIKSQAKNDLIINQQSISGEDTQDNIQTYDGSEEVQINFNLAKASDITNLFNN